MRRLGLGFGVALSLLLGCSEKPVFTEPQVLGGVTVEAKVLEQGRRVYRRYCLTCHGAKGDGRGVSAFGQWPPARDFRKAKFKFAGVQDRGLPADEELERVITNGLKGTYMRPWILQQRELNSVVQYIKTFSPEGKGFRSKRLKVKPSVIAPDPYETATQIAAAIGEGEKLYHAMFQCSSCHPAYATPQQFAAWDALMRPDEPMAPVPKWSENYRTVLLPPDFTRHQMRAVRIRKGPGGTTVHNPVDIYRAIAFGLQGPMPGYEHLGSEKVWAVAHYVKSLADRGTLAPAEKPSGVTEPADSPLASPQ